MYLHIKEDFKIEQTLVIKIFRDCIMYEISELSEASADMFENPLCLQINFHDFKIYFGVL